MDNNWSDFYEYFVFLYFGFKMDLAILKIKRF